MRGFCKIMVMLLVSLSGFASEIEGVLMDTQKRPLTDATVVLVQLRRTADVSKGVFRFADVPPGSYSLLVNSKKFGSKLFDLQVNDGEVARPQYIIDIAVHEDLIVSATAIHQSTSNQAHAVSVLNRENLAEKIKPSLGETLATEPGVSSTYAGPAASRPVIRGLGGDRVAVLEGGMSSGDLSSLSGDHAVAIDPLGAERIEVLRGPASLRYGSSAVGGVVNVVDNRIPEYQPEGGISGTVELRGATGNQERGVSSLLNGGSGQFAWHADGSFLETDDVKIPGDPILGNGDQSSDSSTATGHLENSAMRNHRVSAGGSYIRDNGFIGMAVSAYDSIYGIPSQAHDDSGTEEESVRIDMQQRRADLRGERQLDHGKLKTLNYRLAYTDYEHKELEGEEIGTVFKNRELDFRGELLHDKFGVFHNGSFGLQYGNRDFRADGEEAFVPPNETDKFALFAFEELDRQTWNLTLGARVEQQQSQAQPFNGDDLIELDFTTVSGSIGVVFGKTSNLSTSINLTRTERPPSPEELFSFGPHLATGAFEQGSLDLESETSTGLDFSLRRKQGRVTGELNLFSNRFERFVYERFTGEQVEGLDQYVFSQADARFYGGELHLDTVLLHTDPHHLHLEFGYDFVRGELVDGGNLPRITPDRFKMALEYKNPNFHIKLEGHHNFEQTRVALLETETKGYTFLDASAGYHFLVGMSNHQIVLRGSNLSDREGRVHASFFKDVTLLPGRSLALTWRVDF